MSWLFFSHSLLVLHIFDGYAIVVHHYIHNAVFYFIFKKLVLKKIAIWSICFYLVVTSFFVKNSGLNFTILNIQVHYFWPSDSIALEKFEKKWHEVTNQVGGQITSSTIRVMFGRYF